MIETSQFKLTILYLKLLSAIANFLSGGDEWMDGKPVVNSYVFDDFIHPMTCFTWAYGFVTLFIFADVFTWDNKAFLCLILSFLWGKYLCCFSLCFPCRGISVMEIRNLQFYFLVTLVFIDFPHLVSSLCVIWDGGQWTVGVPFGSEVIPEVAFQCHFRINFSFEVPGDCGVMPPDPSPQECHHQKHRSPPILRWNYTPNSFIIVVDRSQGPSEYHCLHGSPEGIHLLALFPSQTSALLEDPSWNLIPSAVPACSMAPTLVLSRPTQESLLPSRAALTVACSDPVGSPPPGYSPAFWSSQQVIQLWTVLFPPLLLTGLQQDTHSSATKLSVTQQDLAQALMPMQDKVMRSVLELLVSAVLPTFLTQPP